MLVPIHSLFLSIYSLKYKKQPDLSTIFPTILAIPSNCIDILTFSLTNTPPELKVTVSTFKKL